MADRISSYWMSQRPVNDMMQLQADLSRTQEQISTGSKLLSPSDDPVGSARVLQLDQEISLLDQYERNITLLDSRLEAEEGVLDGITDALQRVRELTVQAGNAALYTSTERIAIGAEISQRVEEIYDLMNSKDGGGEYIFSGFSGDQQPFVENPGGGYSYQGDEGVRYLQISQTITIASSDSGKDAFLDIDANVPSFFTSASTQNRGTPPAIVSAGITVDQEALNEFFPENAVITFNNELDIDPPGPNYTVRQKSDGRVIESLSNVPYVAGSSIQFSGMNLNVTGQAYPGDTFIVETSPKQGILVTAEKLEYALNNFSEDPAFSDVYDEAIFNTLENLDAALDNISLIRARIGGRLNTTESTLDQHADNKLAAQDIRSSIQDLDYAEAVSRLQLEEFILQAAQQTFAKVTAQSLFDFI